MGALTFRRLRRRSIAVVFPERCAACGEVIKPEQGFCPDCEKQLRCIQEPACRFCGHEVALCRCRHRSGKAYDRLAAPFYHADSVRRAILSFKKEGDRMVAELFADEMAAALCRALEREYPQDTDITVRQRFAGIAAVPMHPLDRKKRKFNQAELLAEALAERLELPYLPLLEKLVQTPPQKGLDAIRRSGNVLGVFDVIGSVPKGARLLLVDDVSTTGCTLHECAKMLKLYGCGEVWAVTAALAIPSEEEEDMG